MARPGRSGRRQSWRPEPTAGATAYQATQFYRQKSPIYAPQSRMSTCQPVEKGAWFRKGSGTVVRSTLRSDPINRVTTDRQTCHSKIDEAPDPGIGIHPTATCPSHCFLLFQHLSFRRAARALCLPPVIGGMLLFAKFDGRQNEPRKFR